jgi:N-acetylmuramoyl-L-alanine amidase
MKIKILKSPNHSIRQRRNSQIRFLIIHYTGMQSERESIKRLTESKSQVSSHYLINQKGDITKMIEEKHIAWHAGKSRWKNFTNLNSQSIGIELVNKGHSFGYDKFSKKQTLKLVFLCKFLIKKYKIRKFNILGHSDIAPLRKKDPGEKFPWQELFKKKIGFWYDVDLKDNKIYESKKKNNLRNFFFSNLHKIGYRYFDKKKTSSSDSKVIKAFQRRFRQNKVNGQIDKECLQISHNLAYPPKK